MKNKNSEPSKRDRSPRHNQGQHLSAQEVLRTGATVAAATLVMAGLALAKPEKAGAATLKNQPSIELAQAKNRSEVAKALDNAWERLAGSAVRFAEGKGKKIPDVHSDVIRAQLPGSKTPSETLNLSSTIYDPLTYNSDHFQVQVVTTGSDKAGVKPNSLLSIVYYQNQETNQLYDFSFAKTQNGQWSVSTSYGPDGRPLVYTTDPNLGDAPTVSSNKHEVGHYLAEAEIILGVAEHRNPEITGTQVPLPVVNQSSEVNA